MRAITHKIADLLPHAPPMILLDEVLEWDAGQIKTSVTIRPGIPFFTPGKGVPAHVALEYMAQACGCFAGLEGLASGQPVRLGYLLGTRNFSAETLWFSPDTVLIIRATEILRQDGMGVFECAALCGDKIMASAQLNLYRPENEMDMKAGQ